MIEQLHVQPDIGVRDRFEIVGGHHGGEVDFDVARVSDEAAGILESDVRIELNRSAWLPV